MAHKAQYPKFTTGRGTAVGFVTLNNPDTKFDKDGKFSVALAFDGEDPTLAKIEAAAEELAQEKYDEVVADLNAKGKKALAKKVEIISLIKAEEDEESGEETGRTIIKASMKHSGVSKKTGKAWKRYPAYFNAKGQQLKNPPLIYAGSVLKAQIELFPYYAANDKTVGVTFRLNGVQILSLVSGGERDASDYGFGEEEGDDIDDRELDDQSSDDDTDDSDDDKL